MPPQYYTFELPFRWLKNYVGNRVRLQLTHVTSYTDKLYAAFNLRLLVLARNKYRLMVYSSIPADTVTYKTFYRLLNFSIMSFFSKIPSVSTVFAVLCRFWFFYAAVRILKLIFRTKICPTIFCQLQFFVFL